MLDWTAIDTVLLDMDGTLLDLRFDNFFWLEYLPRRYAEQHGLPLPEAKARLERFSASLQGSLNWYCLDHWSRELELDIEAIKREVSAGVKFRPGAEDFLRFLRASGKHCVLLTNAHPKALEIKHVASGLGTYLHAMYSTHPFGLAKENEGFWPAFAYATGIDYHRCLFIDDSLPVLRRAREEGVARLLQVLQPDMSLPPRAASEFPGILHFSELLPA
jgi:HAD superfamily hydrolase (TIGR01509 family)